MKTKATMLAAVAALLLAGCSAATQPAPDAAPPSACAELGGTVDTDQRCHVRDAADGYALDFRFPVGYPDQRAVADFLKRRRDGYVEWVAESAPRSFPYELNITGKAYRSGSPDSGTQSLVLTIGTDLGVHPVTTYKAFNYDLSRRTQLTFDALFKPDTTPLAVLNPIVQRELDNRGSTGLLSLSDLGVKAYQNFAITDDAVIFFFDQDGLLPHENGPLKVSVPRTEIASLLA
jgi:hypothetical protein